MEFSWGMPDGWINLLDPAQSWQEYTKTCGIPTTKGWPVYNGRLKIKDSNNMNKSEDFDIWAEESAHLDIKKSGIVDHPYYSANTQLSFNAWTAGQKALIPHMEVLLADIQTIIAFGLFTPSPKLQEAIDFIKSATEEQS